MNLRMPGKVILRHYPILPVLFFTSFGLADDILPTFDNYKVTETLSAKPAKPLLRSPADRMFRTRIHKGAKRGQILLVILR